MGMRYQKPGITKKNNSTAIVTKIIDKYGVKLNDFLKRPNQNFDQERFCARIPDENAPYQHKIYSSM